MSIKKTVMVIGLVALGIGGTATYFVSQDDTAIEIKKVEKMPEEEQQAFLDTLLMKVSGSEKPSDVAKMLSEKVDGLNKDNASEAVYLLMSSVAVEQGAQMENFRVVSDGVISAYNENQFKSGYHETYEKVEDKSVQGFLEELKRQYLFLEDDGEGLYLSQDLNRIEKEYEKYLNESVTAILEVRLLNQDKPYVDAGQTAYDMDKMMERILFIEGKKTVWQETIYEGEMLALQEQAYMDFFGVTHDAYYEEKDGKLFMKEDIKDKMYLLQAEYSNSFMGQEIIGFMDELEADKFEKKDTQAFIYAQMQKRFAVETTEQAPITLNQGEGEGEAE